MPHAHATHKVNIVWMDGWILNLHHPSIIEKEMTIQTHGILIFRVEGGLKGCFSLSTICGRVIRIHIIC